MTVPAWCRTYALLISPIYLVGAAGALADGKGARAAFLLVAGLALTLWSLHV